MTYKLDSSGRKVKVGEAQFCTPGLEGDITVYKPTDSGSRSSTFRTTEVENALESEGLNTITIYEIDNTREVPLVGGITRSTVHNEPALEMTVPGVGKNWRQLMLYKDESGFLSWHLPEISDQEDDRGIKSNKYVVRRAVPKPVPQKSEERGFLGSIGKKVFKILAFKVLDKVLGEVGEFFAKKWEKKYRPHRFRPFTPGNLNIAKVEPFGPRDWEFLSGGPALLLVHGTFSTAENAFSQLPQTFLERLDEKYEGRIFAFDHPTMSVDPTANVNWFLEHLPEEIYLDLDIICHSRGGLVSRLLAEKQADLSMGKRHININRVVMVAVPNSGTILADAGYMQEFINTYTNMLGLLPPNQVTSILQAVISLLKQTAANTLAGLEGLQAMSPSGSFLHYLNSGACSNKDKLHYFALAANFEPAKFGLKTAFDAILDSIFQDAPNDLVVPTHGVYAANGAAMFPIQNPVIFEETLSIMHTSFFAEVDTQRKLLQWLE